MLHRASGILDGAVLHYHGEPVGTAAAAGGGMREPNYAECFTRDFAVSAAAFLTRGSPAPVRNFLRTLAGFQADRHHLDCFRPGPGLMPASFGVTVEDGSERLRADFGQRAIGRVAPVDCALWWLIILRAYVRATGDVELARDPGVAKAIERILELYLPPRFEMLPTLLVPDGAFMIDRRMGVYGHPLEVQALFFGALRAARELLPEHHEHQRPVLQRLARLGYHVRGYYWLDAERLDAIRRYGVEEFGVDVPNRLNVVPDAVPAWLNGWLDDGGGYFAGNVGPSRIDYRFFSAANLLAVTTGLAQDQQRHALFALIERHREALLATVPMKLAYPAVEGETWRVMTGADPKNAPWSYHNGGSWPFLLWLLASAGRRAGDTALARDALTAALPRLDDDGWPEYYEGRSSDRIGRQARAPQTWTAAAVLAAERLLRRPANPDPFVFETDAELEASIGWVARESGAAPSART